jgi:translation initiation factor 1
MKDKKRIPTDGEPVAWKSPFAGLKEVVLPPDAAGGKADQPARHGLPQPTPAKHRGRVDIIRQTAHRGGKTVTVITGFAGISQAEKEQLAKEMQKACGVGGTVKEGRIEIQGDRREDVARILTKAGFRPVFAGG